MNKVDRFWSHEAQNVRCVREADYDQLRAELAAIKGRVPVVIGRPEYSHQGMGCGLEDAGITDRYEAMQYGFDQAMDQYDYIITSHGHLYAAPAPAVVMPERDNLECLLDEVCGTNDTFPTDEPIYSISLSEVIGVITRLNAADQEGGQDE